MMQLTLKSGKTYPLDDDEAENVKKTISKGDFVNLRSGECINVLAISQVGQLDKFKYYDGCRIFGGDKYGYYFVREGEKIPLGSTELSKVIEKPIYDDDKKLLTT